MSERKQPSGRAGQGDVGWSVRRWRCLWGANAVVRHSEQRGRGLHFRTRASERADTTADAMRNSPCLRARLRASQARRPSSGLSHCCCRRPSVLLRRRRLGTQLLGRAAHRAEHQPAQPRVTAPQLQHALAARPSPGTRGGGNAGHRQLLLHKTRGLQDVDAAGQAADAAVECAVAQPHLLTVVVGRAQDTRARVGGQTNVKLSVCPLGGRSPGGGGDASRWAGRALTRRLAQSERSLARSRAQGTPMHTPLTNIQPCTCLHRNIRVPPTHVCIPTPKTTTTSPAHLLVLGFPRVCRHVPQHHLQS